jgi:hypothetical protein
MKWPPNGAGVALPTPSSKLTRLALDTSGACLTQVVCAHSHIRTERELCGSTSYEKETCIDCGRVLLSLSFQRWRATRHCVECGDIVSNVNLGGHTRCGALAGRLFCLSCADGRRDE